MTPGSNVVNRPTPPNTWQPRASFFAADQAIQTHGGLGYATEYHVERYWREARLQRLAPVSQEMTLNYIAQNVLGLPKVLLRQRTAGRMARASTDVATCQCADTDGQTDDSERCQHDQRHDVETAAGKRRHVFERRQVANPLGKLEQRTEETDYHQPTPAPPRPRSPRVASPRRSHSRRRRNGVDHRRREPDGRPPGVSKSASGTRVRTSMLVPG